MKIVIIGSVAAGTSVAAKARRNNEENEIVIYERDSDISYSGCGLPYYIGNDYIKRDDLTPRDPKWFKDRMDIEINILHEVLEIDKDKKILRIKNLKNGKIITDDYDKLVIATGSKPVIPPIDGIKTEKIFFLSNIRDGERIRKYVKQNDPKSAIIIGGGYIGLELLENLHNRNMDLTLIEREKQLIPNFDLDVEVHLRDYLIKKGVNLELGKTVTKIEPNGKILKTDDGNTYEADMIIVATGVKPNTKLAENIDIELGNNKAIKVDKKMRTNIKDIYAVGDCAQTFSRITGEEIYIPLGSTANKMGRIAGDVITGGNLEFRGVLGTGIFKSFDMGVGCTGLTEKEAIKKGYDIQVIHNIKNNQTKYFKDSSLMVIKAIADKNTQNVLGVQIVGKKGIDKRLDVFVSVMTLGGKISDLFHMDFGYAPPFSTTKDPVMYTGMVLDNAINGRNKIITPTKLRKQDDDFLIIDVRSNSNYKDGHIKGAINIPLQEIRGKKTEIKDQLKGRDIVVHCNKGVTGNLAQNLLLNMGFKEVYNISGGYKQYSMEEKYIKK
ncbi:MAG: FAD-dependent oxidoreductase [Fusobacteriota bacterium]